jgi:hypothetical protein
VQPLDGSAYPAERCRNDACCSDGAIFAPPHLVRREEHACGEEQPRGGQIRRNPRDERTRAGAPLPYGRRRKRGEAGHRAAREVIREPGRCRCKQHALDRAQFREQVRTMPALREMHVECGLLARG